MAVGELDVGDQPDVGVEREPAPVGGLGGQVLERLQLAVEGEVVALEPVVLARHVDRGVHVDDAGVAVDDQVVALVHRLGQVLDAHHGRDLE